MQRLKFLNEITSAFLVHPIVTLLGPRQCGKTTLARQYITALKTTLPKINYFDLENLEDLARLKNPLLTLKQLRGLIVIDEIQLLPDLFSTLRVLIDAPDIEQRYLILGSASRDLLNQSSETLAGRIQYIQLTPFNCKELDLHEETAVIDQKLTNLWLRGGFPKSYCATSDKNSSIWRDAYIKTFLERDIPNLGIRIPSSNIRRFWMMLTHYHGNICNHSELGRSMQLSGKTIKQYVDLLESTFMIRQLSPWFENIKKRQVKSPKIYFRDSGILHSLMRVHSHDDLLLNPKIGASWEGFMLEEVLRLYDIEPEEAFFWSTQSHAELDLMIVKGSKKFGFEFKYTDQPKLTKSMRIALECLNLENITVLYAGDKTFPLSEKVTVTNLPDLIKHNIQI
ncbi:MAG: hypothetical protein COB50_01095 [Thiotrichales bacterium]|nr:MAG: hypothetical protein COB50_01095 [Thiotrichales bacterium]